MLALLAALLLADAGPAQAALAAHVPKPGARAAVTFAAPELGDPAEAHLEVRTPARYADCRAGRADCWLLVYLPGFDSAPGPSLDLLAPQLEALERAGGPPVVAVALDGRTRLGGGWYADSPASGRWASLLEALLPAARAALLPRAGPERTLLIGHSMGGYGALRFALAHPGAVAGVGALNAPLSPEALAEQSLARAERAHPAAPPDPAALAGAAPDRFFERALLSLGAAFAPGLPLVDAAAHPWRLTPAARARLAEAAVPLAPGALAGLGRVYAATGKYDPLAPPASLEALGRALGGAGQVTVHSGDHTSGLADAFAAAVRHLTAPRPARR